MMFRKPPAKARLCVLAALTFLAASCERDLTLCQVDDAQSYVEAGKLEVLRYIQGPLEEPCLLPGPLGCLVHDWSGPQGYGADGLRDGGGVLSAEYVAALTPDDLNLLQIDPNTGRGGGFYLWYQTSGDVPWSFHITYYGDCSTDIAWGYAGNH